MNAASILVGSDEPGQSPPRPLVLVIAGSTASGKTDLALRLARIRPIEIINGDSRAFYRGMDAGTAKPTVAERAAVPHHLIDILPPDAPMSITEFQALALAAIEAVLSREALPVITGGSPQYLNALVEGWQVPPVPPNPQLRQELEREASLDGVEAVWQRLRAVDPVAAGRTGPNLRRIIRALEVWDATGIPFSAQRASTPPAFRFLEVELWWPREILYERIDRRVDAMVASGLVEEVTALLAAGYDPGLPAFSSIGYRQLVPAIREGADLARAIERIKTDTHRLVRHQQTWFRRNSRLHRIDMTQGEPLDALIELLQAASPATGSPESG
jgi:tRNA dimethylallyltransferase